MSLSLTTTYLLNSQSLVVFGVPQKGANWLSQEKSFPVFGKAEDKQDSPRACSVKGFGILDTLKLLPGARRVSCPCSQHYQGVHAQSP